MKPLPPKIRQWPFRKGMALLTVLMVLGLMMILMIALLGGARSESAQSQQVASRLVTRQLTDVLENLTISQLRKASVQVNSVPGRENWAAQPGLLRQYTEEGDLLAAYRLYSHPRMVEKPADPVEESAVNLAKDGVPSDWDEHPARYVDLNAPVFEEANGDSQPVFPIVDPRASIGSGVEGFSYDANRLDGTSLSGVVSSGDSDDLRLPMPVEWIFILRDGTMGTLDDSNRFIGAIEPTVDNPIIGRIAFWADDLCGKINSNTASEPTTWDVPRFVALENMAYANSQPARYEYQRFNGSPLTNALSTVLWPGQTVEPNQKEGLYNILPRTATGGSMSGTKRVIGGGISSATGKAERLYTSVGEMVFSPRLAVTTPASRLKAIDSINVTGAVAPPLTIDRLQQSQFFLTTHSRAPELTPFGTPKISIWPVDGTGTFAGAPAFHRTAFDSLVAFCASPGGYPYFFQRRISRSRDADWINLPRNRQVYSYLKEMTSRAIPGVGASFKDKWNANLELHEATYTGEDHDQNLVQIMDYIRMANLRDPTRPAGNYFSADGYVCPTFVGAPESSETVRGFGREWGFSEFGFHFICNQKGKTGILSRGDSAIDLGDNTSMIQTSFLFETFGAACGYRYNDNPHVRIVVTGLDSLQVNGKNLGFKPDRTNYTVGGTNWGWHGHPYGASQGIRQLIRNQGDGYPFISDAITVDGDSMNFSGGNVTVTVYTDNDARIHQVINLRFPPATLPVPKLVEQGTTAFRGGTPTTNYGWWSFGTPAGLGARMAAGIPKPAAWPVMEPGHLDFGRYRWTSEVPHRPGPEYGDPMRVWRNSNGNHPPGFKSGGVFRAEDVVRTLVPRTGDNRLVLALPNVPAHMFEPVYGYTDSSVRIVHQFSEPMGSHMLYGFTNEPGLNTPANSGLPAIPSRLVQPLTQLTPAAYHFSNLPDAAVGAGRFNLWNDFDNGPGHFRDGALINKPDEGNLANKNGTDAYFAWDFVEPTVNYFSPGRMIPSAGMFGSLPSGLKRGVPWMTHLFRPEPKHPGAPAAMGGVDPADHYLAEYFWMPSAEPWAISEPLSTTGKINLNYQIIPFTHIRRATAMHAALKSEEPAAVPNGFSRAFKLWDHHASDWPWLPNQLTADPQHNDKAVTTEWTQLKTTPRIAVKPIAANQTLLQFDRKFDGGKIFRYPSEICQNHLVREGESLTAYEDNLIWPNHLVTGENARERPYANLLPRLTTQSNTWEIHYRVQSIRKARSGDPAVFDPERDRIEAEARGSSVVERFIDANDPLIPDYTMNPSATPLNELARFRVISQRKFP